jgi:hypothetical protein
MRFLYFLFLIVPFWSNAQITDNFTDAEILSSPTWTGDIDSFNAIGQRLNSAGPSASSVVHVSTPNAMIDNTEWHFTLSLDFNPSSTNFVKVFLVSNNANLESSLNGYYVFFGETGNDSIIIYRQSGTTSTKVFKGVRTIMPSSSTSNNVGIKIIRDATGLWSVYTDNTGGTAYLSEGSFTDNTHTSTNHFGVVCDYGTASRNVMYHFDNIYVGNIIVDIDPPLVEQAYISNLNTVSILFNEYIDTTTAIFTSNYSLTPSLLSPTTVEIDSINKRLIHLKYATALSAGVLYNCSISGVTDLVTNVMTLTNKTLYIANKNDIVINEIYADPDSTITSLPNAEFIEIKNVSTQIINLNNWKLYDASTIGDNGAVFPNISLLPNEYAIVCDWDDTLRFQPYGKTISMNSFPSMNNSDDELLITDNFDRAINYVNYTDKWYKDDAKKSGGYTLERIDPSKACVGEENWKASVASIGGTPATINSVDSIVSDTTLPMLLRAKFIDNKTIELLFNESIDESSALLISNYTVDNGLTIASLNVSSYTSQTVLVTFTTDMNVGTVYTISLNNLKDCSSNIIGLSNATQFGIPQTLTANDIVINEVLFNPATGGYDFVELYNRSNKIIDLKNVKILEQDPTDLSYTDNTVITTSSFLLMPSSFVVLTENTQNIIQTYYVQNPGALLAVAGMPNYEDNEGIVEIYFNLVTIDKLHYDNAWHYALLDIEDGVSLERINYEDSTQKQSNWHSAATTVGFATPSYKNSQFIGNVNSEDIITIEPEIFTPDEDGDKDVATINFTLDKPGYMLGIRIYDANGRLVRTLINNELVADKGRYTWDGINDNKEKARVGIYVIYTDVFDASGKTKHYKNKVVLGTRF